MMWFVGIFTALLSSILGGLGDNLIRLSFIIEEEKNIENRRPVILRPIWLIGVLFSCILNAILIIISLNFASAMIVTPFSGLHIFWSIIFSKYILNEEIRTRHYKGTGLVILGLLFIVIFGLKDVPIYNVKELEMLYIRPKFMIYCLINVTFIIICFYITLFGIDDTNLNDISEDFSDLNLNLNNYQMNNNNDHNDKVSIKDNKDIIINKNTLHLKLSNIKQFINKYNNNIIYNNNEDIIDDNEINELNSRICSDVNSIILYDDFENYEDNNNKEDNNDYIKRDGIEYNNNNNDNINNINILNMRYGNLISNYINSVELKINILKDNFFELTKKFPRINVSTSIKRFCMCSTSGLSGGYTNVLVQNFIQMIIMEGFNVLLYRLTYQLLIIILITGSIQLFFWNAALSNYQAIFVVPIVNSVLVASSGFCNLMLYYDKQYEMNNNLNNIFFRSNFLFGQFLIILGIYIISRSNRNTNIIQDMNVKLNSELFDVDEYKQNNLINNNFSFKSKFFNLTDYFKLKKKKISSSLESLLGLYRGNNNSNNNNINVNINNEIINDNYINKNEVYNNRFHFNNAIILPQEVEDEEIENQEIRNEDVNQYMNDNSINEYQKELMNSNYDHSICNFNYRDSKFINSNENMNLNEIFEVDINEDNNIFSKESLEIIIQTQTQNTHNKQFSNIVRSLTNIFDKSNNKNNSSQSFEEHQIEDLQYEVNNCIELESYVLDEYDIDELDINNLKLGNRTSNMILDINKDDHYQDKSNQNSTFDQQNPDKSNLKNHYPSLSSFSTNSTVLNSISTNSI